MKKYPSTRQTYKGGDNALLICNSGNDFIDLQSSFLAFSLRWPSAPSNTTFNTGADTLFNSITRIRIEDRSGTELDRLERANVIINNELRMHQNPMADDYERRFYSTRFGEPLADQYIASVPGSQEVRWFLPLKYMSGIFGTTKPLPPQLMSGLRFEFTFEQDQAAYTWTGPYNAATDQLEYYNVELLLQSCRMTDAMSRHVAMTAAASGLCVPFRTWFTVTRESESRQESIDLRKAATRGFRAVAWYRDAGVANSQAASLRTNVAEVTKYQWRAGSMYYPQQPVQGDAQPVAVETLLHTYDATRRWGSSSYRFGTLNVDDYNKSKTGVLTYNVGNAAYPEGGFALLPVSLERSQQNSVSGIPLNNARVLNLAVSFDEAKGRQINVFLQYMKVLKVYVDHIDVEE
jgi:hypothetical protein